MTKGTPASSQIIWLTERVEQLEDVNHALTLRLRDCLIALKQIDKDFKSHGRQHWPEAVKSRAAITALQEPVAYRFQSPATEEWLLGLEPPVGSRWEVEPLYAAPPQRKPQAKARAAIAKCEENT